MPECVVQHPTHVILMHMTEDRIIHSFLFSTIRGMLKGQKKITLFRFIPATTYKPENHSAEAEQVGTVLNGRRYLSSLCTWWALVRNPCRQLNHHPLKGVEWSLRLWNYIFSIYGGLEGRENWSRWAIHNTRIQFLHTIWKKLWMMKKSYQNLLRVAAGISEHDNYWMPRKHHFCPI